MKTSFEGDTKGSALALSNFQDLMLGQLVWQICVHISNLRNQTKSCKIIGRELDSSYECSACTSACTLEF